MRMWMVDPKIMCRKHLLGEHVELHMFKSVIRSGKTITGFVNNNLLEMKSLDSRHEALKFEMVNRGYKHNSPYDLTDEDLSYYNPDLVNAKVDPEKSLHDLIGRCEVCKSCFEKDIVEQEVSNE